MAHLVVALVLADGVDAGVLSAGVLRAPGADRAFGCRVCRALAPVLDRGVGGLVAVAGGKGAVAPAAGSLLGVGPLCLVHHLRRDVGHRVFGQQEGELAQGCGAVGALVGAVVLPPHLLQPLLRHTVHRDQGVADRVAASVGAQALTGHAPVHPDDQRAYGGVDLIAGGQGVAHQGAGALGGVVDTGEGEAAHVGAFGAGGNGDQHLASNRSALHCKYIL